MNKTISMTKPNNFFSIDDLPLNKKFDEISNTITNCMITVICSDNNTGKTIGVPNRLSRNPHIKGGIFCSVPTASATISMYEKQNQLCNLSNYVGFSYNDKVNYNNSTKIIYCTYDNLLNLMIPVVSDIIKNPWFCSVLILDDFSSRRTGLDICLCLWIHYYKMWKENPSIPKPPKLVIMTTEMDEEIIRILPAKPSILSYAFFQKVPTIVFDLASEKLGPDSKYRSLRTVDIVSQYHINDYDGTYMIFLPNPIDVKMIASVLKKKFNNGIELILNNTTTISPMKNISDQKIDTTNRRKIILATPDDEFSFVTNNVTLVVDTLTRTKKFSLATNPETTWITLTSSFRRKSKISSKNLKTYVVMQSSSNYFKLSEKNEPEIKTDLIDHHILKLFNFNLNPRIILTPLVAVEKINKCLYIFKKIGLCNDNLNSLSPIGSFCCRFPINIRKAAMIYYLHKLKNPNIFLYMAVICTLDCYGSGFFVWPRKKYNEDPLAYSMRCDDAVEQFEKRFGGYSDIDTLFRIWIELCSKINPFYITDLKMFCQNNRLNFKCFKETVLLLRKCMLANSNINFIRYREKLTIGSSEIVDYKELSNTFYSLLAITHPDHKTTIIHKSNGNTIAVCNGFEYKIDRKAIHLMNVGNSSNKIYYSLVRTHKYTKKGKIQIINVLHAVFDESDNIRILISESESDDNLFSLTEFDYESIKVE